MTPYLNESNNQRRRSPRSGFTMIEMLVVIGILALLASLSLMAFRGFIGNARVTATQTTIVKIDELLHQRMEAFTRWIDSMHVEAPGRPEYVYDSDYSILGATPGDVNFRDVAMVLARKNRYREFFPQRFSDIPTGGSFPPASIPTHTADTENAECLYYLIMKSQVYGIEPVEDGFFLSAEFGDTDDDGLMEFLDNWGNPIRFYRWPTRLLRPGTTTIEAQTAGNYSVNLTLGAEVLISPVPQGDAQTQDPDDPNGFLPMAVAASGGSIVIDETTHHTLDTYHTPLIVSAGQDGSGPGGGGLGLYEPVNPTATSTDEANFGPLAQPKLGEFGDLTDNITNLNSRVGGR
ncbi:MAG: prepilin-type N-terminal cleavage/methylation domain-containing protein [Planctomycetaceae bacterium]